MLNKNHLKLEQISEKMLLKYVKINIDINRGNNDNINHISYLLSVIFCALYCEKIIHLSKLSATWL